MKLTSITLLSTLLVLTRAQKYKVVNKCPDQIDLYVDGDWNEMPMSGETQDIILKTPPAGIHSFYTNYNGGRGDGLDGKSTKAIVNVGKDGKSFYYLQKNTDAFNTGIKIEVGSKDASDVEAAQKSGFCEAVTCDDKNCQGAASELIDGDGYPQHSERPPTAPLHSCALSSLTYTITFCPSGNFPNPIVGKKIHPAGDANKNKCVDVIGGSFKNGESIAIYDCNDGQNQRWILNNGKTPIKVDGKEFCIDLENDQPRDGDQVKIHECLDDNAHQRWEFIGGSWSNTVMIKHAASSYCLNLKNGKGDNQNPITIEKCNPELDSQKWVTQD